MNTNPSNTSLRTNGSNGSNGANGFSGEVVVHLPGIKDKDAAETDFSATQATKPVSTPDDKEAARDSTKDDPIQKQLKSKAEWLRNRLSQTLESLAQRKQDAVDITHQIKEHPLPFALAGGGALLAIIGGITLAVTLRPKLPPTLGERLRAVGEAWTHPDHVSKSRVRSSKAVTDSSDFTKKAVLSVISLVVAEAAKFGFAKFNEKRDIRHPQPL